MSAAASRLSNPYGSAGSAAAEYVAGLLRILGDRDPWEVQEAQVARLAEAVAGLDDAALRVPEAPGKWSVVEVVRHLADTELVYGYRLRKIVAEPGCAIEGYDQDSWARSLGYLDAELPEALEQHRALRTANLRWLRTLDDEELDRYGVHTERGPESMRHSVRLIAAHDLLHLRQIERIRRAIGSELYGQ